MTHKDKFDNYSKTYSSLTFRTDITDESNQDRISGITMQCPKPKDDNGYTDFYVYHVDVGSSRSFDNGYDNIN